MVKQHLRLAQTKCVKLISGKQLPASSAANEMNVAAAMHDGMPTHDTMMQCRQVQHTLPCCKPMICLMA